MGLEITELGFTAVVLVVLALVALVVVRRRVVAAGGAMVICSYRLDVEGPWRHGLARFEPDALLVYSLWGLSVQPRLVVSRSGMTLLDAHEVVLRGATSLIEHPMLVTVTDGGIVRQLVVPSETCTAVRSWGEATPPGRPPQVA